MATILEFKSAPKPAASVYAACGGIDTAEIVFFPGVRYERHPDESEPAKANHRHEERERDD